MECLAEKVCSAPIFPSLKEEVLRGRVRWATGREETSAVHVLQCKNLKTP